MMKVKEIGFVAVPVNDVARARQFYEGILALEKSRDAMEGKWIEYDLGGGTLALGPSDDDWKPPSTGTGYALEVEDFDQAVAELRHAGVEFVAGPAETAVCYTAIIQDPGAIGSEFTNSKRTNDYESNENSVHRHSGDRHEAGTRFLRRRARAETVRRL
jgi:predicted enzyme related to lactoylglutathione lyase